MRRSPVWSGAALASLLCQLELGVSQQAQPNPCFRWSGQMAIGGANFSKLFYYGGEASLRQGQESGLWTNALVAIDLTKDFPSGTPPISLVQADNGNYSFPPAVALGALWASKDGQTLYQYGGQFSDTPDVPPPAQSVFQYSVPSNQWSVVQTTGDTITRAAEGSTAVVPGLGQGGENVGYYFSGHLDDHTTQGWSDQIERLYLSSLVEFDLGSHAVKNISTYSPNALTSNSSTPIAAPVYRADGTVTFVPGLGTGGKGILVAIGGATSTQYVDNSVLDVYDIGAEGWTKQATLGDTIGSRVNHCTVRASAKVHGTEFHQLFVYGGQQLNQSSRDSAMYILSIPSFTWTFVGDSLPGQPTGRAGHQCAISGSQMIIVGGVVAGNVICDQPGIYIYDVSKSAWVNKFTSGTIYTTPSLIANVTGGIGTGTSSSGSGSASGGDGRNDPDTSGKTNSGSTGPGNGGDGGPDGGSGGESKSKIGPIVGGVVGGIAALLLLLLLAILLRRRKRRLQGASPGGPQRIDSDNSGEVGGQPYEKQGSVPPVPDSEGITDIFRVTNRLNGGPYRSSQDGRIPASDNVEAETQNMEAAFGSHLVPKRTLRVTNPELE